MLGFPSFKATQLNEAEVRTKRESAKKADRVPKEPRNTQSQDILIRKQIERVVSFADYEHLSPVFKNTELLPIRNASRSSFERLPRITSKP